MSPRAFLVLLSVAGGASIPCAAQPPTPSRAYIDLVRRSGFIFQGTVRSIGAATPTVVRQSNTAIVLVARVWEALPPVGNVQGREVTVRLRNPEQVRPGQTATFFTYVYSAGQSLGVQEVGILPREDTTRAAARIQSARRTLSDDRLSRRLVTARLVVVGSAGEARPAEGSNEHRGEHDPLWWRVPIRVETVLKGSRRDSVVLVNFARSDDPAWERSPKPRAGDRGIYLLQPTGGTRFRVSGLFLVDSLDVLDGSQADRVRRLLRPIR